MNGFKRFQFESPSRMKENRGVTHAMSHDSPGIPNMQEAPEPSEMKVSGTMGERMAAFRLVHQMYYQAGLTADNAMQMRVMKHHLVDTTDVLVAKRNGTVEFTATLVRDGKYGLPAESLFPDEIQAMRSAGVRLAEVSCVASHCGERSKKQRIKTLIEMISLTIHVARRRGIERLLLAVHPRHAKVYRRMFGCVPCSEVRQYDAVQGNPAVLCMHDFAELDQQRYSLYDEVYGANYSPWSLDGARMSDAEKHFFRQALNGHSSEVLPMAA